MLTYIARVVTVFSDGSKSPRYYEFRKLSDAKSFIANHFQCRQWSGYTYDIAILKCKKLR